ncbi:MAG: two-component system, OmpR family, sensor kinase [Solirubrobacteraceae bacterium]|jgi:two-component system OmpR family sensor kinase|nr:two-component system, OmpR family, sensor kinase [Solirubrobacteraceae bacterium]
MQSLRGRLLVLLIGLSALGLLLVGGVSYGALRSYLSDRVDKQVVQAFPEVAHDLADRDYNGYGPPPGAGPGAPRTQAGTYGAVVDADGTVQDETTLSFPGSSATTAKPELPKNLPVTTSLRELKSVDVAARTGGGRFRVTSVRLTSGGALVVAVPLGDYDSTLHRLLRIELLVALLVLLVLGAAAWFLVRVGLSPLERMGRTAGAIAAGDLSRRVEPATERTEVGRLGLSLNAMLGQIERAFAERKASEDRLRTFLSDASHELRTPLASIRGYAELMRMGAAGSEADRRKATERIEAEAKRMGVLVEDLLTLARLDEEREMVLEDVDLAEIAGDATAGARAAAQDREISLVSNGPVHVTGDAGKLRQIIDNLLGNAVTHTPPGTAIDVRVARDETHAHLDVRDHGPGLPEGDAEQLFDRFWRAEGGRKQGKAGAGLGLAIVAGLVSAHGGEVSAENAPGGGARFSVSMPMRKSS